MLDVDADRKGVGAEDAPVGLEKTVSARLGAGLLLRVTTEIAEIAACLEADEIVFEQASHQPFVVRGCRQQVGRRKGDVQEKADTLAAAALAQLGGEWDQVIIVYPDYVVRLQEGQDGFGESLVDPPVAFQERLAEIDQ